MKKVKAALVFLLGALVASYSSPALPSFAASDSINVDCANVLRSATHCADGSLYGMTESLPADIANLVVPVNPCVIRSPARSGQGNQHPFGSAIAVAGRLSGVTNAKVSVDLADMLPNWPYRWPGMSSWINQVNSFISDKKASGYNNFYGYEIWNEPDGTWSNSNGDFNSYMWPTTYRDIRSNDPGVKIVGPCYSYYNHNTMRTFLSYCKANNCLPDIMSWHELSGTQHVAPDMKDYRALETSLGINALPISINEYCDSNHNLEGQPGSLACFFGKFERYKTDSACISWWFNAYPGRLGSILATNTATGAGWYMMNWYGQMSGNMVNVSVANDESTNIDGCACVNSASRYVSCLLGGNNSGTVNTTFRNLPSFIGSSATVTVQKVDWTSKDTVSYGPSIVSTSTYPVSNNQITVTMTGCNNSSGYRIFITPGTGSIVSGNTYTLLSAMNGLALDNYNTHTAGTNAGLWAPNGEITQNWTLNSVGNGYYTLTNQMSGMNLDNGNSTSNGAHLIQSTAGTGNSQLWKINNVSGSIYTLSNKASSMNLDNGNSYSNGQTIMQWNPNGNITQEWIIQ